jgi:aspyridone synthetase (hybrid polyketide synthase/nonribosomal peptide synthetase)
MAGLISDRAGSTTINPAIDWDQETSIPDDLRSTLLSQNGTQLPLQSTASCREVLLTGADGFLGGHILQALLRNSSIQRVHCVAVPSSASLPSGVDFTRITVYDGSSLHQPNFGLDNEAIKNLVSKVDRIIIAGTHGHCLNMPPILTTTPIRQP